MSKVIGQIALETLLLWGILTCLLTMEEHPPDM